MLSHHAFVPGSAEQPEKDREMRRANRAVISFAMVISRVYRFLLCNLSKTLPHYNLVLINALTSSSVKVTGLVFMLPGLVLAMSLEISASLTL